MKYKFKKGDRVVCVDIVNCDYLTLNKIYTIDYVDNVSVEDETFFVLEDDDNDVCIVHGDLNQ